MIATRSTSKRPFNGMDFVHEFKGCKIYTDEEVELEISLVPLLPKYLYEPDDADFSQESQGVACEPNLNPKTVAGWLQCHYTIANRMEEFIQREFGRSIFAVCCSGYNCGFKP